MASVAHAAILLAAALVDVWALPLDTVTHVKPPNSVQLLIGTGDTAACQWKISFVDSNGNDHGPTVCTEDLLGIFFVGNTTHSLPKAALPTKATAVAAEWRAQPPPPDYDLRAQSSASQHAGPAGGAGRGPPPADYERAGAGGWLYKLHTEKRRWAQARWACEREGAHLLVLDSPAEAAALRRFLDWKNVATPSETLVKLHAGFRRDVRTVHGNTTPYEEWDTTEPGNSFCGVVAGDGWLQYGKCDAWLPFVCEAEAAATPAPAPENAPTTLCAPTTLMTVLAGRGYAPLPGWNTSYVKNMGSGYSWTGAKGICAGDGAHLAIVENQEKADALIDYMKPNSYGNIWLGLKTEDAVTVQGKLVSNIGYQRWTSKTFEEACFFANEKLMLFDVACTHYSSYIYTICEVNVS